MRKITQNAVNAFMGRGKFASGNTYSDGQALFLHGNKIAEWINYDELWISTCGWPTSTTKERLGGLPGVQVNHSQGILYLNGLPWDGQWIKVS